MLEVLYHHAKFGGVRISPAARLTENVEFFLSVCLFVRHAFERQRFCARFRHGRWSTETILVPLDRGRFVVVHPVQLSEIDANWRHH